jgi:hypothetical protein
MAMRPEIHKPEQSKPARLSSSATGPEESLYLKALTFFHRTAGNKAVGELLQRVRALPLDLQQSSEKVQRQVAVTPTPSRVRAGTTGSHRGVPYVFYEREIRLGGTPAWRNNNPGNMEYGSFTQGQGAIGRAGRWAIFPDEETGFNAILERLQTGSYAARTIAQAIFAWAPPSDRNDTPAYIASVRQRTGLDPTLRLDTLSGEGIEAVANAIRSEEGVRAGETITCGLEPAWTSRLLGCSPPSPPRSGTVTRPPQTPPGGGPQDVIPP